MKDLTELKEIKLSEKLNNTKSEGLSSTDKEKTQSRTNINDLNKNNTIFLSISNQSFSNFNFLYSEHNADNKSKPKAGKKKK